jgi:hypothetical protein
MRFLCTIWLPALGLVLLAGLLYDPGRIHHGPGTIGTIGLVWLYVDIPVTVAYIGYRVFFRAKRDGQAYSLQQP